MKTAGQRDRSKRAVVYLLLLKLENILPQFKIERLEARGGLRERDRSGRSCGAPPPTIATQASPEYLARRGTPKRPEDLIAHACLHHRFATSGKLERWPLRRNGKDIDLAPPPTAIANTIEPLIYMAEQGLGIACLQDSAVRRQIDKGTLKTVLDEYVAHVETFRLLWPSSRYPSPKLRVFIGFMADNLFAGASPPVGEIGKHRRSKR